MVLEQISLFERLDLMVEIFCRLFLERDLKATHDFTVLCGLHCMFLWPIPFWMETGSQSNPEYRAFVCVWGVGEVSGE